MLASWIVVAVVSVFNPLWGYPGEPQPNHNLVGIIYSMLTMNLENEVMGNTGNWFLVNISDLYGISRARRR